MMKLVIMPIFKIEISYTTINDNEQCHIITKRIWYRISLLYCDNYSVNFVESLIVTNREILIFN